MGKLKGGYKKIEKGTIDGYKKIEETVVGGYKKIEDKFVDKFLRNDDETIEEAKERIKKEQEELAKKTMFITGMHCEHCVQSVTDSLNRIDGVSARVDLNKSCAEISLDREIGEDILICAVEKAGFLVESIQS